MHHFSHAALGTTSESIEQFGDDGFTQAAVAEQQMRAAHGHAAAAIIAGVVGVALFAIVRMACGCGRRA